MISLLFPWFLWATCTMTPPVWFGPVDDDRIVETAKVLKDLGCDVDYQERHWRWIDATEVKLR